MKDCRGRVVIATDKKGAEVLKPFIDNLDKKPDVIIGSKHTVFVFTGIDWDLDREPVQKFEAAMKELDCYEFVFVNHDGPVWKHGNDNPGIIAAGVWHYSDKDGRHILVETNCNNQSK